MSGTATCRLNMPGQAGFYDQILANARHATAMSQQDTHVGQTVAICGAGPSLATATLAPTDEVWACNSALPYLMDRGDRVTHGLSIDQGEAMLGPSEWARTFDVGYRVASCVHPRLIEHLVAAGRSLTFFHSFLGIPDPEDWQPPTPGLAYEMYLYQTKYRPSVQVGHGLNSVPRAICLAVFMGFARIDVYGADCAAAPDAPPMPLLGTLEYIQWLQGLRMYADGRNALTCFGPIESMAEGVINGRRWHTRADMLISARHMVEMQQAFPGRIVFHGDTLVNAVATKDAAFWEDMPVLSAAGEVGGLGIAKDPALEEQAA